MTQHNDAIRMRHMLDHARKAVAMARGQTREDLDRDEKLNLALTRLVEIIGEAAARVSKGSRERHEGIPWVHIIALRNRLIHGYDAVDLDILWDIIQLDLPALIQSLETALGKSSIRSIQLKSKIKPIKPTIPSIPSHPVDLIISTVNVKLDWNAYLNTLKPRGRLHVVGAVLEPLDIQVFPLLFGQRSVSSSPVGAPATIAKMLDFADRHHIQPVTEHFPFEKVNDALEHLRAGKARYRIVLEN